MLSCIVFLFFNFRKRARCFAGDVGSVSIAFWILMLLIQMIIVSGNLIYLLFLAVYGVDSVLTIIHRIILKQNIFEAHRLHFYQLLANECHVPHLLVSSLYAFIQLVIIAFVIAFPGHYGTVAILCCLPLVVTYVVFKPLLMKFRSH